MPVRGWRKLSSCHPQFPNSFGGSERPKAWLQYRLLEVRAQLTSYRAIGNEMCPPETDRNCRQTVLIGRRQADGTPCLSPGLVNFSFFLPIESIHSTLLTGKEVFKWPLKKQEGQSFITSRRAARFYSSEGHDTSNTKYATLLRDQ